MSVPRHFGFLYLLFEIAVALASNPEAVSKLLGHLNFISN